MAQLSSFSEQAARELNFMALLPFVLAMAEPGGIDELHRQLSTVLAKMRLLLRHFEALTP